MYLFNVNYAVSKHVAQYSPKDDTGEKNVPHRSDASLGIAEVEVTPFHDTAPSIDRDGAVWSFEGR